MLHNYSPPSNNIYNYGVESAGSVYDGQWRDDKKHGFGTEHPIDIYDPDGRWYVGEWRNGKRHGHGIETMDNGDVYNGEWCDGKYHGHGIKILANDNIYNGEWKYGEYHGYGIETVNGDVYDGAWAKGEKCGKYVEILKNGDIHEGMQQCYECYKLYDDTIGINHDIVIITKKNGEIIKQEWHHGELIKNIQDERIKMINLLINCSNL